MKPLIFKRNGLWCCRIVLGVMAIGRMGLGYTPRDAYFDWLNRA